MIVEFRESIPEEYGKQFASYVDGMILNSIASAKQAAGMTDQAEYVKSKLAEKPKIQ